MAALVSKLRKPKSGLKSVEVPLTRPPPTGAPLSTAAGEKPLVMKVLPSVALIGRFTAILLCKAELGVMVGVEPDSVMLPARSMLAVPPLTLMPKAP